MRFEEETEQMRMGFLVWVNLGKGRTYKRVADILHVNDATVGFWAKFFKWGKRLEKMEKRGAVTDIPSQLSLPAVSPSEDATQAKLDKLAGQLEEFVDKGVENLQAALDSGMVFSVGSLTKLTKELRETLVARRRGGMVSTTGTTNIDKYMVVVNQMTQEEQLALFTVGHAKSEIIPGRDIPASSGSEEADYDEIPDGGVEDGNGCDGISGGAGRGESGDEGELPSGGSRVSLLRFE
jgi:hypothetical protein